jgi:hypothetical protein
MESNAPPLIAPPSPAPTPALTAPASASEARALLRALIRLKWAAGFASALAVFSLAGLFLTYQRFSTLRPIVLVGGQRITLRDYEGALERRDNGKVLHDMVSAALVRQAAAGAGVLPTDDDVSARLALIQQRDPGLVQAAAEDGSLPLLRDQLLDQIALENLRIRNVPVSDAEVDRYYQAHRASFQQRAQAQMALVVADTAEEADAAADDLRDGIPLDVIAEQKGLYVAGEKGYRVSLGTPQGRTLAESWKTMRSGETRTAPLGRQFLVAQMVSVEGAGTLPLQTVRASVARLARLEKTIPAEAALARLYRATPPSFPVDKYAGYFDAGARAGR